MLLSARVLESPRVCCNGLPKGFGASWEKMMQRMGWREFFYLDIDGLLYFLNYLSFLPNMCILFLERSGLCLLNTTEFCSYSEHYLLHWTAQISFSLCAVCGHYYILFLFHITSSLFPQKVKYLYQCNTVFGTRRLRRCVATMATHAFSLVCWLALEPVNLLVRRRCYMYFLFIQECYWSISFASNCDWWIPVWGG